jgi:hypothetical protein
VVIELPWFGNGESISWQSTHPPEHSAEGGRHHLHDFGRLTVSIIVGLRSLRATNTRRDLIKAAT